MISISIYEKNPIRPTFFGLLNGTYNFSIKKERIVTNDELDEIALLSFFGITNPSIFKREPHLKCAVVINEAMKDERIKWRLIPIYKKIEAMLRQGMLTPKNKWGEEMKINYRVRRAVKEINEALADEYRIMARQACNHAGKEFNTTTAWQSKGSIESLEQVKSILNENNLSEWS